MKYLALLRDSFREALDSKMLYFTLGLSLLLILILSSLTFRPLTAEEQAQRAVDFLNFYFWSQEQLNPKQSHMEIVECVQLNPEAEPWEGNYRLVVTLDVQDPAKIADYRKKTFEMLTGYLWWRERPTVAELHPNDFTGTSASSVVGLLATPLGQGPLLAATVLPPGQDQFQRIGKIRFVFGNQGTKVKSLRSWRHEPSLVFGLVPIGAGPLTLLFQSSPSYSVYWIEDTIVSNVGAWVIILIGIIVTAGIVPTMMEKGAIDLLLVKPIARPVLLLVKYLGGLTFVLVNSIVAIGGVWLVFGVRTGIWSYSFLLSILIITFFFAIYYSVSVLVGVVTRNSLIAILVTCLIWGLFFGISFGLARMDEQMNQMAGGGRRVEVTMSDDDVVVRKVERTTGNVGFDATRRGLKTMHDVLPRTDDLSQLNSDLLSHELLTKTERRAFGLEAHQPVNIWETFGVSLAFIAVMLGLACWRFTVRDY